VIVIIDLILKHFDYYFSKQMLWCDRFH